MWAEGIIFSKNLVCGWGSLFWGRDSKQKVMFSEPSPRERCFSAPVKGEFCVWGGRTKKEKKDLRSTVHCFNPVQESWTAKKCSGPPPPGLYEGACTFAGHHLYVYGGHDGKSFQCTLHQLDMSSMTWKQLSSAGPSRKYGCDMVIYKNKLILFGGYGDPLASTQPAQWNGKYTNELHTFDLEEGESVCGVYISGVEQQQRN